MSPNLCKDFLFHSVLPNNKITRKKLIWSTKSVNNLQTKKKQNLLLVNKYKN